MPDDIRWRPPSAGEAAPVGAVPDPGWVARAATALDDDPGRRPGAAPDSAGGEPGPGEELLRVEGLTAGYGSVPVLHGVDLAVAVGETAVILGLNGAGKTTTAKVLCGALAPSAGTVTFDGAPVGGWDVRRAVRSGVVMCPEGRRVFPQLSVAQNLDVGAWTHRGDPEWIAAQRARVYGYFPRLAERADQLAGTLSGGEQQMCAIGRALMARPRLLIIDEASLGLAPVIVKDVFEIVRQINADGTTVILIEQNVGALEVATVGLIMEQGRIVDEVRGAELADPEKVRKAFLG